MIACHALLSTPLSSERMVPARQLCRLHVAKTLQNLGYVLTKCSYLTIWDKLLNQLVNFFRLLALPSAFAVYDITANTPPDAWRV